MSILSQCINVLPVPAAIFSGSESSSNTLRSFEKLRRLCGKVLEEERGRNEWRNLVKLILEGVVKSIEIACNQVGDFYTSGSDLWHDHLLRFIGLRSR